MRSIECPDEGRGQIAGHGIQGQGYIEAGLEKLADAQARPGPQLGGQLGPALLTSLIGKEAVGAGGEDFGAGAIEVEDVDGVAVGGVAKFVVGAGADRDVELLGLGIDGDRRPGLPGRADGQ